jgi:SAM-dependent methyltransferase
MTAFWTDPTSALGWAENDAQRDLLALPRVIAAELVAIDRPDTALVADVGSGPGDFLAVFLERFPNARGIWSDISEAMAGLGRERLDSARVDYRLADMTDFTGLPTNLDVLMTSRAVHHLDRSGLHAFYRAAADHLAPGGWLVNLDHFGPSEAWNTRLREARKRLVPRVTEQRPHHHTYPLTGIDDHLSAFTAAGLTDAEVPWRSFVTGLFMARRAD